MNLSDAGAKFIASHELALPPDGTIPDKYLRPYNDPANSTWQQDCSFALFSGGKEYSASLHGSPILRHSPHNCQLKQHPASDVGYDHTPDSAGNLAPIRCFPRRTDGLGDSALSHAWLSNLLGSRDCAGRSLSGSLVPSDRDANTTDYDIDDQASVLLESAQPLLDTLHDGIGQTWCYLFGFVHNLVRRAIRSIPSIHCLQSASVAKDGSLDTRGDLLVSEGVA